MRRHRRQWLAWVAAVCWLVGGVGRMGAHAELLLAEPPPGAQLAASPRLLRLTFGEALSSASGLTLRDNDFQPVTGLTPRVAPDELNRLFSPLPPLSPGVYTVEYAAVSVDGHVVNGSYEFAVLDSAESPPSSLLPWFIAGGSLALAGLGWFWRRSRRPAA